MRLGKAAVEYKGEGGNISHSGERSRDNLKCIRKRKSSFMGAKSYSKNIFLSSFVKFLHALLLSVLRSDYWYSSSSSSECSS